MCNATSLSAFLEGVNFMDEEVMNLDVFDEDDLLCEDGLMLDMDVDEVQHALLNGKDGLNGSTADAAMDMEFLSEQESLPPLDLIENDADLAALMANDDLPISSTVAVGMMDQGASLEKLANCMRQSEMTLRQQQSILAKAVAAAKSASPTQFSQDNQAFAKASPFFTGSRFTITPELEKSRALVRSFIQSEQPVWTQNPPTTAAA